MIHELPLERANLHGHFSRELPPVLTVDPGDSVRIDVPNAGWWLDSRERVRADLHLEWPIARVDGAWSTFGFDADLGLAAQKAMDGMVALMEREHGLDANDALAVLRGDAWS